MAAGTCFDAVPEYAAVLLPTVLLIGVGFALGFPTLNMQATCGIADHEQGLAVRARADVVPGRRRALGTSAARRPVLAGTEG